MDAYNNLYIADTNNNAVRLGLLASAPPSTQTARLVNLSVRANAGSGSETLIGGFAISGSGQKSVLIRGDGPSLSAFGVSGFLPDPELLLFENFNPTPIASNSGWGGSSLLSSTFTQVGAFAICERLQRLRAPVDASSGRLHGERHLGKRGRRHRAP